jgi:hypothetical protein
VPKAFGEAIEQEDSSCIIGLRGGDDIGLAKTSDAKHFGMTLLLLNELSQGRARLHNTLVLGLQILENIFSIPLEFQAQVSLTCRLCKVEGILNWVNWPISERAFEVTVDIFLLEMIEKFRSGCIRVSVIFVSKSRSAKTKVIHLCLV